MEKDKLQLEACQVVKAKIASFEQGGLPCDAVEQYCKAYGLELGDARAQIFSMNVNGCNTACYVFKPQKPKACVLLVHGYLDHAMAWRKLIPRLLKEGYVVFLYDLPGHGFSDGARADIGDFGEYSGQLAQVMEFASRYGRLHTVAHSTGAGILADMLMHDTSHADMLDSAVLIAPLLHSAHWGLSRMAVEILPLASVRRTFRKNSSDASFMEFQKADPLQHDRIPVSWTNANAAWSKKMSASSSVYDGDNVLFIQGDKDKVVDWKYNMKFYRQRFPKAKMLMLEKGRHQLMNEAPEIVGRLESDIVEWLGIEREGR
ncbi:MAG: alpha/beta hydrolase [Victivallales bacterium]|nr:alpha/beta hydrolase [Victivallales bacterium]